ncbi:MAG: FG-GAP-like repeat-containing protein [Armatimonadetes bacterium]|nr:FG-GAP-like repeat-containing protein [Armatimonadota bacterium]
MQQKKCNLSIRKELVNVHAMRTVHLFWCIGLLLLLGLFLPAPARATDFSWKTTNFIVGNSPVVLAAGDFNRDGKEDLAFGQQSYPYTITILIGKGNGTFSVSAAKFNPGFPCSSLAAGDFNGDGWADLALRDANSGRVHLLLNAGNGAFQTALTPTNIQFSGNSMTAADFNGDGLADLAVHKTGQVFMGFANNYLDIGLNPGVPGQTPAQQSNQNQGNTGQQSGSSPPTGQTGNPLNPNPFSNLFQGNPFGSLLNTQNQINIQQYLQNQGNTGQQSGSSPPTGQTDNPYVPPFSFSELHSLLQAVQNQGNTGQQSPSGSGSGGQNQGLPVTTAPEIRVTSPNGGESWAKGSTQTIRWTHAGDCGNTVSILLWWKTGTGQGYRPITPVPVSIDLGEYSWTIPTNWPSYSTCKVLVMSPSKPSCKDMSDDFLSIY